MKTPALLLAAFALIWAALVSPASAEEPAWAALGRGAVALVRHGETPGGSGDPPGFKLDDCATQRPLNERGRQQSVTLGETFRRHGIVIGKVLSSQWCRSLDTATLMALGAVEAAPPLNNLGRSEGREAQLAALAALVSGWRGPGALVMVSHGSTILALTGENLSESEILVVQPQPGANPGWRIVSRIAPPR